MATGTAGTAARNYGKQMVHYLRAGITFASPGTAVAKTVGILPAGALVLKPLSGVMVITVFNASGTGVIDVGTTATADLLATDLDVKTATLFMPLDDVTGAYRVAADTTITATYTGTGATTGDAEVIIAYCPDIDQ